jgi:uncharacterized protein DUF3168
VSAVDPADAIQVGLYELFTGDVTLAALANVYDEVPEDAELPYVVIGEMTSTPDGAHGSHGRDTSIVLHTWTEAPSNRPGNQIGARLVALLARQAAALDAEVTGHKVWMIEHEFAQTLHDPQPGIRHRVDRFRVWTRQEA